MQQYNYQLEIEQNGFAIRKAVLSPQLVDSLINTISNLAQTDKRHGGIRNLLNKLPAVRELTNSISIKSLVHPILGPNFFPVRAIFFDKVPEANWGVAWHQDLTIAVKEKIEVPGFSSWSKKEGIVHVHPPMEILQQMLTVRIHLDGADENNGALWVVPSSHNQGRLGEEQLAQLTKDSYLCRVDVGDVLVMRPLLLHSSRKSTHPYHRRVIHLDFANQPLPAPLQWFEQ
jgi:hypothetical protein